MKWLILFLVVAVLACWGQRESAVWTPKVVKWSPNVEPDLMGYVLYVDAAPVVLTKTNHFQLDQLNMPRGVYRLKLTAVNSNGIESQPTPSLVWTNLGKLTVQMQGSDDLLGWTNINECYTMLVLSNRQQFYRALLTLNQ
jgi:hypothetical protein